MKFAGAILAAAAVANAAYVAPEYPNVPAEDCAPLFPYATVQTGAPADQAKCITYNPSSYDKPSDSYPCDVNDYKPPTTTTAPKPTETCATPVFYHQGDGQYLITPDNYILQAENDQPGCQVKLVKCPPKIDYVSESSRGSCWTKVNDHQYRNGHGHCLHWHKNQTHHYLTQQPCGKPAYKPQAWSCGKPDDKPKPKPKPTPTATPVPTATDCPTPTYVPAPPRTCADWAADGNTCGDCYFDNWVLVTKPGSVQCGCDEQCADVCCTAASKPSYPSNNGGSYGNTNNNGGSYGNTNNGGSYGNTNNNGGSYGNTNNGGSYGNNNNNNGGSYGNNNNNGGSYGNNNNGGSYKSSTTADAYTTSSTADAYTTSTTADAYTTSSTADAYTTSTTADAYTTSTTADAYTSSSTTDAYTPTSSSSTAKAETSASSSTSTAKTTPTAATYKYNTCTEWFMDSQNQCDSNQNPIDLSLLDNTCGHNCSKSDCCVAA